MNKFKTMTLILALATLSFAGQSNPVAGTWKVKGDVMGYPVEQTCIVTQEGTKLTGSCKSAEADKPVAITGEVNEKKVTWKHSGDYQGQELTITYAGTLGEAELNGTIEVQLLGVSGTFIARKEAAK
jgi:hypothetical protein